MRHIEHIMQNAEPVRMTADEKALIRQRLVACMDAQPIRSDEIVSPYVALSPFGKVREFAYVAVRRHVIGAALAVVLISGGSLAAAADTALPGDSLYLVKVKFNEEIAGLLAVTPEAKAKMEAKLAEKRLEEAADLSVQGRLTSEVRAEIASNFETHVKNTERHASTLALNNKASAAMEVASGLESALRVREKVILDLTGEGSDESDLLASSIRQELTSVSQVLNSLEREISQEKGGGSEKRARAKSLEAEKELSNTRLYIAEMRGMADPEAIVDAENQLKSSLTYLSRAYTRMESGSYSRAFIYFQKSIGHSTEARLTVSTSLEKPVVTPSEPEKDPEEEEKPGETASSTDPIIEPAATSTEETGEVDTDATTTDDMASTSISTATFISDEKLPERTGERSLTNGLRNLLRAD